MAQPPLSQAIRRLEADLGVELFERTTRNVALTDAGHWFRKEAEELLRHADDVERRLTQLQRGDGGTLRVGFVDSASYDVMPRFLRAHRERFPDVDHELHTMSSDEQADAILAGAIDIGIARVLAPHPDLAAVALVDEPLVIAAGPDHRLSGRRSTGIRSLADESFIGFDRTVSPTLFAELTRLFAEVDTAYDPEIEATEYTTVVGLVAAGLGIAVVPACVRTFRPPGLTYLRLNSPDARTRLVLITRADADAPLVRQAIDLAERVVGPVRSRSPRG